jgi:TldD protein
MNSTLVEKDVLERVLGEAMGRGGEFAEVFVEDRTTSSATLDQRRVEELSSGRDRGAGIRVWSATPRASPTPPTSPSAGC